MEKKIKEIYGCKKIVGDDKLVIWHNQVIEKKLEELTISDVARCIRQNLFLESAYDMLLVYLLHNPYVGDVYEGEFMDKACEIKYEYVVDHKEILLEIVKKSHAFIDTYDWQCEEDKEEFAIAVENLMKLIKL